MRPRFKGRHELKRYDNGLEKRDICPLNDDGSDLTALPEALCWTIGPIESRLASAQALIDGGEGRRVAIRDLFGGGGGIQRP